MSLFSKNRLMSLAGLSENKNNNIEEQDTYSMSADVRNAARAGKLVSGEGIKPGDVIEVAPGKKIKVDKVAPYNDNEIRVYSTTGEVYSYFKKNKGPFGSLGNVARPMKNEIFTGKLADALNEGDVVNLGDFRKEKELEKAREAYRHEVIMASNGEIMDVPDDWKYVILTHEDQKDALAYGNIKKAIELGAKVYDVGPKGDELEPTENIEND
jgi:hypothetical protein